MTIAGIGLAKQTISQIFDTYTNFVFRIPKYQREYVWGRDQWEALYDDINENPDGHFLGTLICVNTNDNSFNSPDFEVIDGQQRLTSISLLLAALYTEFNNYRDELDDGQKANILKIRGSLVREDGEIRVVPQSQGKNEADYRHVLYEAKILASDTESKNSGNRRIEKAYHHFLNRIEATLAETRNSQNPDEWKGQLVRILKNVYSAIVVTIEVHNHADAYRLFATLNDRGTPLTAVDLIKNMLLAELDKGNDKNCYEKWKGIIDCLGNDYSAQERFFRQNYNAFRTDINKGYGANDNEYPLGTLATGSNVLSIYEKLIRKDANGTLAMLAENAKIYAEIISEDGTSYPNLLRVQSAPSHMLVLYLKKKMDPLSLNAGDIERICDLIVRFFIRRNITDTPPTRDLTRIFLSFIETLESEGYKGNDIYENLCAVLIRKSADDKAFEEKLKGPIYRENREATRFILCRLAESGMTKEKKDLWQKNDGKYVWSIEHIFPQGDSIPQSWIEMIADGDKDAAEEYRRQYVHTLGNLTLTAYNGNLSNKSFEEKKELKDGNGNYIGYRNGLNLNTNVYGKDKWTVADIRKRTDDMVADIMRMFAL